MRHPPFANLYPSERPTRVPRFELMLAGDKWVTRSMRGVTRTATGRYTFISASKKLWVARSRHLSNGHIDLADGNAVDWAGEIFFSNRRRRGTLRWRDNASGHYRPDARYASLVGLPMDKFRAYSL